MQKKGFTLIELGVVISAISILTMSALSYNGYKNVALLSKSLEAIKTVRETSALLFHKVGASHSIPDFFWLQQLAENDFIATNADGDVNIGADAAITRSFLFSWGSKTALLIKIVGLEDSTIEDVLSTQMSSFLEGAPGICNAQVAGNPVVYLCYSL